jgi:hypothetical protein
LIVPDKNSAVYLNRQIQEKDVRCLCQTGVLPFGAFLRAVSLSRSEKKWLHFCLRTLFVAACMAFGLSAFFFVISQWHFVYTTYSSFFLCLIFIACSFLRRFASLDYAGAAVIGALVFLPDLIFGANVFLYKQFFLWFFLSIFWAVPSSRSLIRLLPLFLLNVAIALYGWQFVLPSYKMNADTFCILAVVLNLSIVVSWEKIKQKTVLPDIAFFRFIALFLSCAYLLAGVGAQIFLSNGAFAFLYCFIFTVFAGWFVLFKEYDRLLSQTLMVFCFLWLSFALYYVARASFASAEREVFFVLESFLITTFLILKNQLKFGLKEE